MKRQSEQNLQTNIAENQAKVSDLISLFIFLFSIETF